MQREDWAAVAKITSRFRELRDPALKHVLQLPLPPPPAKAPGLVYLEALSHLASLSKPERKSLKQMQQETRERELQHAREQKGLRDSQRESAESRRRARLASGEFDLLGKSPSAGLAVDLQAQKK